MTHWQSCRQVPALPASERCVTGIRFATPRTCTVAVRTEPDEASRRTRILHVVHRFGVGGMENGVVNLINGLPPEFAEHIVVALTEVDAAFARRVRRTDTRFIALDRPPGQTARIFPRLYRLVRELQPTIFHTRNVGTLETQLVAWWAGVPVRLHGEHGWDVADLIGTNRRLHRLRRLMRPFVHRQIALSAPTHRYLAQRVGVPADRISEICNGVDVNRFAPASDRAALRIRLTLPGTSADTFLVGAVGRLAAVKNLPLLLRAFALARTRSDGFRHSARLVLVGDGPERRALAGLIEELALESCCHLAGARDDVPQWLQALDLLCLPSLAEGISNAILEAMASGVPVVATDVGGNAELIRNGMTGWLVPSQDVEALTTRLLAGFADRSTLVRAGAAARQLAVTQFSLERMISTYHQVYLAQLRAAGIVSAAKSFRGSDHQHT